jgi:hypothetical protein
LTVNDGADSVTSPQMLITVGQAPTAVIKSPGTEFYYAAGDTISFSGIATDAEDGVLPASAFTWAVVLEHLTHEHPFIPSIPGARSGSFVIATTGHDPENTHFRIRLTVRDSDGIPTIVTRDIFPYVSPLTLDTVPSGIPVLLDGRALQTPRLYGSVEGFHHQITAQASFVLGGTEYVFRRWSNDQPRVFSFDAPEGGLILTAEYGLACYANCDGSTVAPILTANDFQCFLNRFASGDALANCDGSTTVPVLTANDFQCFLNSFAAGCS